MKTLIKTLIFLSLPILLFGEEDFQKCLWDNCGNMPPTQSVSGEYVWYKNGDTLSGYYYLVPPHSMYYTTDDTVLIEPFNEYRDVWFNWWIWRNPIRRKELYKITDLGDSAFVHFYDYVSLDSTEPNVRVGYDSGSCEPYSAYFYWPKSAGHAFPGADAVYYKFFVTDFTVLAPKERTYFNSRNETIQTIIFDKITSMARTPIPDSIAIILMNKLKKDNEE